MPDIAPSFTDNFRAALKKGAGAIIEMAQVAAEVHKAVGYMQYVTWLKREFDVSRQTGDNLLNIFRKLISTPNFSVTDMRTVAPSALYLLSAPSTPDEVRQEAIAEAKAGTPVTRASVKKKIADKATSNGNGKHPEKVTASRVRAAVAEVTETPNAAAAPAKPADPQGEWNDFCEELAVAAECTARDLRKFLAVEGKEIGHAIGKHVVSWSATIGQENERARFWRSVKVDGVDGKGVPITADRKQVLKAAR